ncbi:MAG: hypothetical protein HOW73_22925 [Polyangiaceae bacterium]|nr:hypothetical protein [Polyangiaceae bacterium]
MLSRVGLLGCVLLLVGQAACLDSSGIDLDDGDDADGGVDDGAGAHAEGGGPSGNGGADEGGSSGEGGDPIPAEEDPFDPPPAPPMLSEDELAIIADGVDDSLGNASATYSVLMVGLETGQVVYAKNADTARKPASNTKIFTTAASLLIDGEAGRPLAGVYATAVNGGVVQGDLVLFGEHDPAYTPWFGADSRQGLDAIAEVLVDSGITQVTGGVVARGEFLYEGNSVGTMDFGAERSQTANAFRQALLSAGISVSGGASTSSSLDPPGGQLLAPMPSVSLDAVTHAINVPSHNEMADLMMHRLGTAGGGDSTYASGFQTVQGVLDDVGVAHDGLDLNDGSGLSHDNRVTPRHIVDLFRAMSERDVWPAFESSLAISGVRGTIAGRMTGDNTYGRFWGKTGTINGVVALSGVLFHKHNGQRYLASLLANNVADSTSARAALDGAVGALAKSHGGVTGLPATPLLDRVEDDHNGETAWISFRGVDGATGYLIERSADGRTWSRAEARLVHETTHRTFAIDGQLFVRVRAVNAAGESGPSNVLGARVSEGAGARVLFVDGNERYQRGPVPENPLGWGNDAVVAHAAAIQGSFESASAAEVAAGEVDLDAFDMVLWGLGRESVDDESFSDAEQPIVRAYVASGGRLFVSGSEVAFDLIGEGSTADAAFARDVLGIDYLSDDASTTYLMSGDVPTDVKLARFSKLGRHEVAYPDVIGPATDMGTSCLRYAAGVGGDACVLTDHDGGGRVVMMGFPLESLDDPAVGRALVALLGS